jgi:TraB/PrgY/gumN family
MNPNTYKNKKQIALLALFLLIFTSVKAENNNISSPSTWAWEIKSKVRTIYLVGELHFFAIPPEKSINHKLGADIYSRVDQVWTEVQQISPKYVPESEKLSAQVSLETWDKVKAGFAKATSSMPFLSQIDKEIILSKYINELNDSDPVTAYANLTNFVSYIKLNKKLTIPHVGFMTALKLYEKNSIKKKILPIESDDALRTSWWENCNSKEKADILIKVAILKQDNEYIFENDIGDKIQDEFLNHFGNEEKILNLHLNFTEGPIFIECAIKPRNLVWLPHFKRVLTTEGLPVAFIVGLGHVGGKDGLLSLLKKEGYTNIKRIYTID